VFVYRACSIRNVSYLVTIVVEGSTCSAGTFQQRAHESVSQMLFRGYVGEQSLSLSLTHTHTHTQTGNFIQWRSS
jgi:hypothetical protein